jgi:hypothetical protein
MKLNLNNNETEWATAVWKKSVKEGTSSAVTLKDYMEDLFQSEYDAKCKSAARSWKPVETDDFKAKREALAAKLVSIPVEQFQVLTDVIDGKLVAKPIDEVAAIEIPSK